MALRLVFPNLFSSGKIKWLEVSSRKLYELCFNVELSYFIMELYVEILFYVILLKFLFIGNSHKLTLTQLLFLFIRKVKITGCFLCLSCLLNDRLSPILQVYCPTKLSSGTLGYAFHHFLKMIYFYITFFFSLYYLYKLKIYLEINTTFMWVKIFYFLF